MPLEVGLWRVDDAKPVKISSTGVPLESQLEQMIEADPTILGTRLLLIGRQVTTDYGKLIDLLAIDEEGTLHVLELKRDRTPRDVVAQLLDYGSWIRGLSDTWVREQYTAYSKGGAIETAWSDTFSASPPDELNSAHRLTVVAADLDPATERIIGYLADLNVPINAVFFRFFVDDDRSYLARSWLLDEAQVRSAPKSSSAQEPWNGQDWYVSFGEESGRRDWEDARTFGFVSAGGGEWYSRTMRSLPVGARVFACIPGTGYVGVGSVVGPALPKSEAMLEIDGAQRPFSELALEATYQHAELPSGEDVREYVVPVSWLSTRGRQQAFWVKGMFANQHSACKLRNRFTLEQLASAFRLDDLDA